MNPEIKTVKDAVAKINELESVVTSTASKLETHVTDTTNRFNTLEKEDLKTNHRIDLVLQTLTNVDTNVQKLVEKMGKTPGSIREWVNTLTPWVFFIGLLVYVYVTTKGGTV